MIGMSPLQLFISYASEDEATVSYLCGELRQAGAVVWFAPTSLSPTESSWQVAIRNGIEDADAFIYVASPDAARSENVVSEIQLARRHRKTIIVFWLRGREWEDCRPFELSQRKYIDARASRYSQALVELFYWLELKLPVPLASAQAANGTYPISAGGRSGGNVTAQHSDLFSDHPKTTGADGRQQETEAARDTSRSLGRGRSSPSGQRITDHGRVTSAQIDAVLRNAESLQTQGRVSEAIEVCERLLAQGVHRADVRYFLGFLYQACERWLDAIQQYEYSRYDLQKYAVYSCYALGQCARALGQREMAIQHFDEAIDQLQTDRLDEGNADQLIQFCYEAAHAHLDIGDEAGAEEIFTALLDYLHRRKWISQVDTVRRLMDETLKKKWPPHLGRRPISSSRPLNDDILPQRRIDAKEYFAGPRPGWRGPINLRKPDQSGLWLTPPRVPIVKPDKEMEKTGKMPASSDPMDSDTDTKPVDIVKLVDRLDRVIAGMLGSEGNLNVHLDAMPLRQRESVTRGVHGLDLLIREGRLTTARGVCMDLIRIAPQYPDIRVALAEIYVRQGRIKQAVEQYNAVAEHHLDAKDFSRTIMIYQRLLDLDANNSSYRTQLDELLAKQAKEQQSPASDQPPSVFVREKSSLSALSATAGSELIRDRVSAPGSIVDSETPNTPAQANRSSENEGDSENGDGPLAAHALVDPDVLPLWIRNASYDETQAARDAMRQIRERVSSGQLDDGGRVQELATLVQRFRANNQLENAICVLHEMAMLAPDDVAIHRELADAYVMCSHFNEAAVELRAVASLHVNCGALTDAAQVYQRLAEIAWTAHRYTDALTLQRQAIYCTPDDMALRQQVVRYCLQMGRNSEATEQQAIIARAYVASGKSREAISALLQLIMLDKMYFEAYDMLGQIYLEASEYEQSERIYRSLVTADPNNAVATARLNELMLAREGKTKS